MTENVSERLNNKKSRYEVLAKNITRTQAEKLKRKTLRACCISKVLFEIILRANWARTCLDL